MRNKPQQRNNSQYMRKKNKKIIVITNISELYVPVNSYSRIYPAFMQVHNLIKLQTGLMETVNSLEFLSN